MIRILVPSRALAEEVRAKLTVSAPAQADSVDITVWDIDSGAAAPPAELVITARPAVPEWFPRIASVENLKHVHLLSLGYEWVLDHLDDEVTLSNSKGAVEDATAEFALTLILAALRELPGEVQKQRQKIWERGTFTRSIAGSRVLVLGYGGVGSEVVRRLEPFRPASITVLAGRARTEDGRTIHGPQALAELLGEADIVVITLPQTPETVNLVDAEFLRRMPDGALLVNVGRGKIVNHSDLMSELRSGRLQAALDVVDPEPLPAESPLWDTPNLLIASHVAGNTTEFIRISHQIAAEHTALWIKGEPLPNAVAR